MTDTNHTQLQQNFFAIEIQGEEIAFFTSCSGISMEFDLAETKSVTPKGQQITTKIPVRTKYSEIVLKRGFTPNAKLYEWFDKVVKGKIERKTGSIVIKDSTGTEKARFNFDQMWPSKVTASDLSAGSDDVMVEELTMQHELMDWK